MIKTNNQEYKNYDIKVIWRNVYISNNDKKDLGKILLLLLI